MASGKFVARFLLLLLGFLLMSVRPGQADDEPAGKIIRGSATILTIRVTELPVHDKSYGKSRLEISGGGNTPQRTHEIEGVWHSAGFQTATKVFVLFGEFEMGAWLPITSIAYIDEKTGSLRYSKAAPDDWYAFSAIPSNDTRYIVFAGGKQLWVLQTESDVMKGAGRTPQPPPQTDDFCTSAIKDSDRAKEWTWGDTCADGSLKMDAGIITFPARDTLKVSYGNDTFQKRSPKRSVRLIDLTTLFSKKQGH